jgi:cytochrome b6-f complex iron-sulfur subunit
MSDKPSSKLGGPRFEKPIERRDFFGLAAVWAFCGTILAAILGALKLPMPAVFPEADSRFPIGLPEDFPVGAPKHLSGRRLYVFSEDKGIAAVSTVCPHLSCIVKRESNGEFTCPCHGSRFGRSGKKLSGPSLRGLAWFEVSMSPDGRLIVDSEREVSPETRFVV